MALANAGFPALPPTLLLPLLLAILWSLAWKGFALWRAARNAHRNWFIVLLLVNTVGILEMLYIFAFSQKKNPQTNTLA